MVECNLGGELERLKALRRYNVLDTDPEEAFDRITRLVKTVLQMPMVAISLVDEDRQWFKSKQGLQVRETPRDISFCQHTIQCLSPLIVADAQADPRFAENPLVLGDPFIRFYAGAPLRTRDGYNIGTLCTLDTKVRHLTESQVEILEDLGKLVVDELELRLLASTDSLTGAMSRRAFDDQTNREIARAYRYERNLSCVLIDLDHFKSINDTYGHSAGDHVLQYVVTMLKAELRTSEFIGRIGGEEFAVIFPETPFATALEIAERMRRKLASTPIEVAGRHISVTASIGVADCSGSKENDHLLLLHRADMAMYKAKATGRNRVVGYSEDTLDAVCDGAAVNNI
jgi:diguanylate cyclase (GGDEF)-like protein